MELSQQAPASVQIDFTEGRLSLKLDPSGNLLRSFVQLNNQVLERFTAAERQKIGVHVCPGGRSTDSTHSADVDYAGSATRPIQAQRQQVLSSDGQRTR